MHFTTGLSQCGFCFYTPLVYNRLGYNVVSVSIHHWFATGLVTMWFLFLYWFTVGLVTVWFLFLYWFTVGLITVWFLFLYTTDLQQAWLQCGFCFYAPLVCNRLGYNVVSVSILVYSGLGYSVVSVSIHHWFTTGLVTMWFLFLNWFTVRLIPVWFLFLYTTGLQWAWLQCSLCF